MWVGGSLPLIENVDAGGFNGVFRHSQRKLHKGDYRVFRCEDQEIANLAATIAEKSAVGTNDPSFSPDEDNPQALKIGFNQARLTHEREQAATDWNYKSLYRAVRVYGRTGVADGLISKKGLTCSSFITYCYQAAALQKRFGDANVDAGFLKAIRHEDSFLRLKGGSDQQDLIRQALESVGEVFFPAGIKLDGKAVDAGVLVEALSKADSGFVSLGQITV
jgi:hypothetical protein